MNYVVEWMAGSVANKNNRFLFQNERKKQNTRNAFFSRERSIDSGTFFTMLSRILYANVYGYWYWY